MSPPDSTKAAVRPPGLGSEGRPEFWQDFDRGWSMTAELLSATFVWGGIGWLGDRWLGTDPWLMVAGFILGHAVGMYMVWVRSTRAERGAAVVAREAVETRKVRADATEDARSSPPSRFEPRT